MGGPNKEEVRDLLFDFCAQHGLIMSKLEDGYPVPLREKVPPDLERDSCFVCHECGRDDYACVCWHNEMVDNINKYAELMGDEDEQGTQA